MFRSYRLKSKRPLKNLMMNTAGCDQRSAGIGDTAYVKDLLTEKIVTTKLRCSKFGFAYHPLIKFGWVDILFYVFCKLFCKLSVFQCHSILSSPRTHFPVHVITVTIYFTISKKNYVHVLFSKNSMLQYVFVSFSRARLAFFCCL